MSDCIDREKLLEQIKADSKGNEGQYGDEWLFLDTIKSIPSADVVEVVRCKDCKWWDSEEHHCVIRDSYGWDYKPTDFCSYGENAEEQEESEIINARKGEE